ncbi:hypothetical protein PVAP13_8NG234001 [Panicum virgatum]|uniref:Uncharacterized protein n=1 Tax=Panicum virgatum TaxID=38727 RepID=A0A8T0PB93_PANVG|nr:hypothetical protein PVAP13_8NG234001 [Panicum virgatum]
MATQCIYLGAFSFIFRYAIQYSRRIPTRGKTHMISMFRDTGARRNDQERGQEKKRSLRLSSCPRTKAWLCQSQQMLPLGSVEAKARGEIRVPD